ncbi:type II secretion system protein GspG [candidate division CSSED10-310 bacterium]|uniref:Type II secretion system protein GspG n=1 Tax=candidate division CSSED10-310 bacterium TaxID=2855610 RepID=A0ABV6YSS5_UNCC1
MIIAVIKWYYYPTPHVETISKVDAELDSLVAATWLYYRDCTPGPTVDGLAEKLCGRNPQKRPYIEWDHQRLNKQGDLLDPWGNPYQITITENGDIWARSAGPNGRLNDDDDKTRLKSFGISSDMISVAPLREASGFLIS